MRELRAIDIFDLFLLCKNLTAINEYDFVKGRWKIAVEESKVVGTRIATRPLPFVVIFLIFREVRLSLLLS